MKGKSRLHLMAAIVVLVLAIISITAAATDRKSGKPILFRGKFVSVWFFTNMLTGRIEVNYSFYVTRQYDKSITWLRPPEGKVIYLAAPAKEDLDLESLLKDMTPENHSRKIASLLPKGISLGADILVKGEEVKLGTKIVKRTSRVFVKAIAYTKKQEQMFMREHAIDSNRDKER